MMPCVTISRDCLLPSLVVHDDVCDHCVLPSLVAHDAVCDHLRLEVDYPKLSHVELMFDSPEVRVADWVTTSPPPVLLVSLLYDFVHADRLAHALQTHTTATKAFG